MVAGLLVASVASGQDLLRARVLQVGDTRDLTAQALATLTEGMASGDARIRTHSVRAAGRFESSAMLGRILRLLADKDAGVRQAAAIAAANSARLSSDQVVAQLLQSLGSASIADWAVFAASVGRVPLTSPDQYRQVEQALVAVLPVVEAPGQSQRVPPRVPPRASPPAAPSVSSRTAGSTNAVKLEGAARGLESVTRISAKVGSLSPDSLSRLSTLLEMTDAPGSQAPARVRRLALAALRNAKAVDGPLARVAAKDRDDEVRRLAVLTAAAAVAPGTPGAATFTDADREAVLAAGLKDIEPRVRLEALRGWGRHLQARSCQDVLNAAADPNTHVALQALDLLGSGCSSTPVVPLLLTTARALPAGGDGWHGDWHRAAHALVSLAKVSPVDAEGLLPRFTAHTTWQVRMYAAHAAGILTDVDVLVRLGADAHDNVREAALGESSRLQRPEALAVAYDALTRPDYHLVMTAATSLAASLTAQTDRPKATRALLASLGRITAEQKDTSRDPRVAILKCLADTGSASDASSLGPYLNDWDPQVADLAAKAITHWTGTPATAAAVLRPAAPLDVALLDAARGGRLRITMSRGGTMDLRLLPDDAPATVARVVKLARAGYYNGLTFHRVEPTFVLQGGSPGANEYMGDGPFMRDEPGLSHLRGTVGISTRGRDTGDAQLFVNLVDSPRLDHVFTVFAVIERGMDTADAVLEGDVMTRVEVMAPPSR